MPKSYSAELHLKNELSYKGDLLNVVRDPERLHICPIISSCYGQACPKWLKTRSWLYISKMNIGYEFVFFLPYSVVRYTYLGMPEIIPNIESAIRQDSTEL